METKTNEIKEFAIGSKIEYNGKLYEVVEQKFCNGCSLKYICPNNDVVKNNNADNLLSRDKRLSIFGECSSIVRSDSKSVVFKEISINISKDKYYKIAPLFRDDNPSKLKSIEFDLPNGYVIDKYNSDLDKGIIRFKRKWLSIEDIYRLVKENDYLTYRSSIVSFRDGKLIALANLMDIARYFNGNWNYDFTKGETGYMIVYDTTMTEPRYIVRKFDSVTRAYYGNTIFKNEADAQYVIDNSNFRAILDKIFKV